MRFNKSKGKVLHVGYGNSHYQYKLEDVRIEHRAQLSQKILAGTGGWQLDMSQHCALTAQRANNILGCIQSSVASRVKEEICPSALEHCLQMRSAQYRRDMDLLESVQRRAKKSDPGMDHLPMRTD